MTDLPDPLVPFNCDCSGFSFMPLEVDRLIKSDLTALSTGDEFKAAVLLWAASWFQRPASSLPNDDRILARIVGINLVAFGEVKEMALRNWILCKDGRLYHPVVADLAAAAFEKKKRQSARANTRWERVRTEKNAALMQEVVIVQPQLMPPASKNGQESMQGDRGQGTVDSSVSKDTAREEDLDPDKEAWAAVRKLIKSRSGGSDAQIGKFFGGLLATHKLNARELYSAIAAAAANSTQDPKSYLSAAAAKIAARGKPAEKIVSPEQDRFGVGPEALSTWR